MWCRICNREIKSESNVCPLCGTELTKVVKIKTPIMTRIAAAGLSFFTIGCTLMGWAETEVRTWAGIRHKQLSIYDLDEIMRELSNYENSYKEMSEIIGIITVICGFMQMISAICALVNYKESSKIRKIAGVMTGFMAIYTNYCVGQIESDSMGAIYGTGTWILLLIIVAIDLFAIANKVGITRMDYSNIVDNNKPNIPDESLLEKGGWECSSCSKINASYVNTCSCGAIRQQNVE